MTFQQLVQQNYRISTAAYEQVQAAICHQTTEDGKDCPLFGGCNSPDHLRHLDLANVLTPLKMEELGSREFIKLDHTAIMVSELSGLTTFAVLGKIFNQNYYLAEEKYLNLPACVGVSFMPENDLVIPMYERLQQSGIIVFEVDWRYHIGSLFGGLSTGHDETDGNPFTVRDTIISESLLVYVVGVGVAGVAFLVFEVATVQWRYFVTKLGGPVSDCYVNYVKLPLDRRPCHVCMLKAFVRKYSRMMNMPHKY